MLIKSIKLISLFSIVALIACQDTTGQTSESEVKKLTQTQTQIKNIKKWQNVTVTYFDFEGGFYGLVSDKGKKLLPMNLAQEYKIDGTVLSIQGNTVEGMVTIQQWGSAFNITEVKLIKAGRNKNE